MKLNETTRFSRDSKALRRGSLHSEGPVGACLLLVLATAVAVAILPAGTLVSASRADEKPAPDDPKAISRQALEEFNSLIGEWRGVGMPVRFSNSDAWSEKAKWLWDFSAKDVAIRYEITDGRLLKSARLSYDPARKLYRLESVTADDAKRNYAGKLLDQALVLESEPDDDDLVYRITLRRLNEKRTVLLHERRRASSTLYARIAEVGYTREGTRLASTDSTDPVCIVSGGTGTIQVAYKGTTYWVCCTGCKQAFDDDPEAIIADYKARLEQEKKEKELKN